MDLNTETITPNHWEVFLQFLLQSPWTADSSRTWPNSPVSWFLTLCSCTQLSQAIFHVCYKLFAQTTWKTPFFYYCMFVYSYIAYLWAPCCCVFVAARCVYWSVTQQRMSFHFCHALVGMCLPSCCLAMHHNIFIVSEGKVKAKVVLVPD
jgi:hypothetical protein